MRDFFTILSSIKKNMDYPTEPGIYKFLDNSNNIIYVGKAKNLKKRVNSYFKKNLNHPKTQVLVKNIKKVEFIITNNEIEALLLENSLIKKHQPKYNINLKDSKTYAYIKITDEKFPRIIPTRKITKKGIFFGPYTDAHSRKILLNLINKKFKIRTCKNLPKKECLNYHIGICSAPCINKINQHDYNEPFKEIKSILNGNYSNLEKKIKKDMKENVDKLLFEAAIENKKELESLNILDYKQSIDRLKNVDEHIIYIKLIDEKYYVEIIKVIKGIIQGKENHKLDYFENFEENFIQQYYNNNLPPKEIICNFKINETLNEFLTKIRGSKVIVTTPKIGEKAKLLDLAKTNLLSSVENPTLKTLQNKLNLPSLPNIIECFDISNLKNEGIVAGMTRWVNMQPDKPNYRKFNIKSTTTQNDFLSMEEAIYRRYKNLRDNKEDLPDLILIDGGKGQVSSALKSLENLNLKIPLCGIAKKNEEIVFIHETIKENKNSDWMKYLRKIRDNTHRYVITFQRSKRKIKLN